ncbi:HAD family phosphatase [uncultured Paracoccus sp.]|uniref:HAD family hydrolase n=1 Tax=uncultured Paracoccus sp. TaxID=189685 RepID=UPI0026231ED2|nr:HAD family phosphatase [uncultured Paracoccus sp.]
MFRDSFPDGVAREAYLAEIGFRDWNMAADRGTSWADNVAALQRRLGPRAHPAVLYPDRFADSIRDPIEGSWDLLERLRDGGHAIWAITNFSAESWPVAVALHPRLGRAFQDVIVSGRERVAKPDAAIYRLLTARHALDPAACLFIDDSAENVAGARAVGMQAVRFTDPAALGRALVARGLLAPDAGLGDGSDD